MHERGLIYPTLQEPVPLDMGAAETITVDKWFSPLSQPAKLLAKQRAADYPTFFYGPRYDFDPAQTISWAPPLNEPPAYSVPRRLVTASQQSFAYVIPWEQYIAPLYWFRPLSEPPKPRVSILTAQQKHLILEYHLPLPDVTLDEWFMPLDEPNAYRAPRRLGTGSQQDFIFQNVSAVFIPNTQIGWFNPLSEPPEWKRGRRRLFAGAQPAFFMTLHYPRLPTTYLEGYDLTIELIGLDGRTVYFEGYKSNSNLG